MLHHAPILLPLHCSVPARPLILTHASSTFSANAASTLLYLLFAVSENARVGEEGQLQLDCGVLREYLCRQLKPPRNSFCVLGITMQDLYTIKDGEAWNFVFGQASLMDGVGMFSFARYDPSGQFNTDSAGAFKADSTLPALSPQEQQTVLRRCCRVLTHEGTHVIGLRHCIHFQCLMNGSNHLEESDAAPLHLCPLCLRKLQNGAGFDVHARYTTLFEWYQLHNFDEDVAWVQQQLDYLCVLCTAPPAVGAPAEGSRVGANTGAATTSRRRSLPRISNTKAASNCKCPMR